MSTEMRTNCYLPFLEINLTPARLQHSIGVMHVMTELAEIYSLDRTQALTAGLLHDAAKDLEPEQQLALIEEAGVELRHPCERHPVYLHATASACLISKEFSITDRLLLDAISTHSYSGDGPNFNSHLTQCLRSADILAPSHVWLGMRKLKSVVYAGRLEEAALLQVAWLIEYFHEINIPIHPNLTRSFQEATTRLAIGDDFFDRW